MDWFCQEDWSGNWSFFPLLLSNSGGELNSSVWKGPPSHSGLKHFKVCQHLTHSPKALFSGWFQLVPCAGRSQGVFWAVWARSSRKCSSLGEQRFGCCWGHREPHAHIWMSLPRRCCRPFPCPCFLLHPQYILSYPFLYPEKDESPICGLVRNLLSTTLCVNEPKVFWGLCSSTSSITLILLLLWRKVRDVTFTWLWRSSPVWNSQNSHRRLELWWKRTWQLPLLVALCGWHSPDFPLSYLPGLSPRKILGSSESWCCHWPSKETKAFG